MRSKITKDGLSISAMILIMCLSFSYKSSSKSSFKMLQLHASFISFFLLLPLAYSSANPGICSRHCLSEDNWLTAIGCEGFVMVVRNSDNSFGCWTLILTGFGIGVGSLLLSICCWFKRNSDLLLQQQTNESTSAEFPVSWNMRLKIGADHIAGALAYLMMTMIPMFAASSQPNFPIAKPNCVRHCGNISIPFPFGTTPDCYRSPTFSVTCNQTAFNPPKLFLQETSIETKDISVDGQIKIMQEIAHDCYAHDGAATSYYLPWIILPQQFTINNTVNKFAIVGCDAYGDVYGSRLSGGNYSTGCSANCDGTLQDSSDISSCRGLGCCVTSIPADVTAMKIFLQTYENYSRGWDFNNCGYAFTAEESAFNFSRQSLSNLKNVSELPMVLNWVIGNGTCLEARRNSSAYACKSRNSKCYDNNNGAGYRWRCQDSYQGNSYLHDECRGLGIGVGSLLLLLPIWCWLHKLFQTRANKKRKEKFFKRNGDLVLQQQTNESKVGKTKHFPSKDTDNYNESRILGVRASDFGELLTVDQTHVSALIFHVLQKNLRILMIVMILPIFSGSKPTPSQYNFPIAKPNCLPCCGKISIPFPFGTTPDCYQSPTFLVTCNQTASNAPKLFQKNTSTEITDISLEGQIRVLQDILYYCYDINGTTISNSGDLISLPQHFLVSNTLNKFITVGCQSRLGCSVKCVGTLGDYVPIQMQMQTDESCMDFACCETSIPADIKEMEIKLESYYNNNSVRGLNCSYFFLGEDTALNFSRRSVGNLKNVRKLPMVANWIIGNGTCQEAKINLSAYACKSRHSTCYMPEYGDRDPCQDLHSLCKNPETADRKQCKTLYSLCYMASASGYRCRCLDGYEGNPYLDDGCNQIQQQSKSTIIVSIGLGVGIGSLLLLSTCFWLYKLIKKRAKKKQKQKFFKRNGGLLLQQQTNDGTIGKIQFFAAKELDKATDHFNESRVLGQGGQGTVYKGMLSDGQIVAIKKSKQVNENQLEQFINEVAILSQINHRNVVKCLGCCLETEVPLLVYEFVPNGTLFDLIHDANTEFPVSWDMRLKIAADSAGALAYLHSACSLPIYHRDIKTSNILLDEKYIVKVSDFGTSKSVAIDQTHVTTLVKGTFGYLDPEYFQSQQFTQKSDVYSFGVVLIELLTGQRAVSSHDDRGLVPRFLESMEMDGLDEILDDRVLGEGKKGEVVVVARLAQRCLNLQGRMRPTMKEVATELESVRMSKMPAALSVGDGIQEVGVNEGNLMMISDFEYSWTTGGKSVASSSLDSHPLKFETA